MKWDGGMDNRVVIGTHGQKRPASDDFDNEQPFTKRFNLLNLGMLLES